MDLFQKHQLSHCKIEYNKKAKMLGYPERTYKSIERLYFRLRTSQKFYQATPTTGTKVDDGLEDVTENTTLATHSEEMESFPPINAISGEYSVDAMWDTWDLAEECLFTDSSESLLWQESNSDFCDDESIDFRSGPNGLIL